MREPYIEGVAIYGGPEPCVGRSRGWRRSVGRGTHRRAIEPRNHRFGVPTPYTQAEGNIVVSAIRELAVGPARSENLGMCGIFMRENREVPRSPACGDGWAGRAGNALAVIP